MKMSRKSIEKASLLVFSMEWTKLWNQILKNQKNPMYLYRGSSEELQAIDQTI